MECALIDSGNGLAPIRLKHWLHFWSTGLSGTYISDSSIEIYTFSFNIKHSKMPSAKYPLFCFGSHLLIDLVQPIILLSYYCMTLAKLISRIILVSANFESFVCISKQLQWRHYERNGVSNHRRLDCLLSRLFRHRSKKTSKLRVPGLSEGKSPVAGKFPTQRTSNAEIVSIWWRHHVKVFPGHTISQIYIHFLQRNINCCSKFMTMLLVSILLKF